MVNDDELEIAVLHHLKIANVDYAFSIARNLGVDTETIISELEKLEKQGYVKKVFGKGLKRTRAKMKRSPEVTKHHTYYTLTKEGKEYLKNKLKNQS
ncbi:MAG: DUF2250 domain-containing protein [Nitrososphaeria archaeon]|nr:DUF2250 domain-containing protein [Conexivisphaerales archaeon]